MSEESIQEKSKRSDATIKVLLCVIILNLGAIAFFLDMITNHLVEIKMRSSNVSMVKVVRELEKQNYFLEHIFKQDNESLHTLTKQTYYIEKMVKEQRDLVSLEREKKKK